MSNGKDDNFHIARPITVTCHVTIFAERDRQITMILALGYRNPNLRLMGENAENVTDTGGCSDSSVRVFILQENDEFGEVGSRVG